jgi:hypothetical protein
VALELRPPDAGKRRQYCEWFLDIIRNSVSIPDKTFFTDEALFHLNGYITFNAASRRENAVWYAVSGRRILESLFFFNPLYMVLCTEIFGSSL